MILYWGEARGHRGFFLLLHTPCVPSYSYVVDRSGTLARGFIEAADEADARTKLRVLGLHPHSLVRASPPPSRGPSFRFRGKRVTGEVIVGTVEAASKPDARDRLEREYGLVVQTLEEDSVRPSAQAEERPAPSSPSPLWRMGDALPLLRPLAGWLIAWYGIAAALGVYQRQRVLPWDVPLVESVATSPTVILLLLSLGLFLLLSDPRVRGVGGVARSAIIAVLGILVVVFAAGAI